MYCQSKQCADIYLYQLSDKQFLLSAIGLLVNMNLVFCVFYAMSCGLVVWLVVYAINISGCFVLFGTVISILMKRKFHPLGRCSDYLHFTTRFSLKLQNTSNGVLQPTVPLGDWLKKKNVPAIIIKQQFGFPISTT